MSRALLPPAAISVLLSVGSVALLAGPGVLGPQALPPTEALLPPPTEVLLVDSAHKADKKRSRKAWMSDIRRHAPGTDWKAMERRNGLQQIDKRNRLRRARLGPTGRWTERGSQNQAGRAHMGVHSTDGATLYLGSSRGGVWKGTLDGADWTPIGDNLFGGAHRLFALTPDTSGDPDTLIVTTNDGLIHTSDDDGETWVVPSGVPSYLYGVRRMVRSSDGAETLYFVFNVNGSYRLHRSTDKGASVTEIHDFGGHAGDVWVPRDGGSEVYLLDRSTVYVSDDLGDSWTTLGSLPRTSSTGELVGSEAGAPRLWAALDGQRLYRSDDLAKSWTEVATLSDYWGSGGGGQLSASIVDEDLVLYGGVDAYVSQDGGSRFSRINSWADYYSRPQDRLHADMWAFHVEPDGSGGEIWYLPTDGGLYRSTDGLDTVENLSLDGMRISQYYSTLTDIDDPDLIAAGAQDQGYQTTGGVSQDDNFMEFTQVISGDYGHITSHDGSHDRLFTPYPGFIGVFEGDAPSYFSHYVDFPSGEGYPASAWIPPLVADPDDYDAFFGCFSTLYRFELRGNTWAPSAWSAVDITDTYGGYISALALGTEDTQRAYAATSNGVFLVSDDKGVTWTQTYGSGPTAQYLYGSAIAVDPSDDDVVYIGGSGYSNPGVYRSTDGGQSWTAWGDGLPATMVYDLVVDGDGAVYAATHTAAYRRAPGGASWVDITGSEAPVTIYWSVEHVPAGDLVRFGTYGRGIWDYDLGDMGFEDADEDGYTADLDCDDGDDSIFPGAEEVCDDGIDQDCDGVDEPCPDPVDTAEPTDSGEPEDSGEPTGSEEEAFVIEPVGCGGCAAGGGLGGAWLAALLLGLARRRD